MALRTVLSGIMFIAWQCCRAPVIGLRMAHLADAVDGGICSGTHTLFINGKGLDAFLAIETDIPGHVGRYTGR